MLFGLGRGIRFWVGSSARAPPPKVALAPGPTMAMFQGEIGWAGPVRDPKPPGGCQLKASTPSHEVHPLDAWC